MILSLPVAGLAGVTAFILSCALTPVVRQLAVRYGWVARPVDDRWGRRVVARLGGVAMFLGFLVATLVWVKVDRVIVGLLIGSTAVFLLGLVDDVRRMPPYTKLAGQLLVGCVVVMSGIHITLVPWSWLSIPLSILWFVLVMNAFNLLDNMDGLAAGVGAISAAFCAVHGVLAGHSTIVLLASIIGGTCLGFLCFNFPPARIFMGDSGSHLLGLSLSIVALMGSWRHSTQLLSVLAIPTLVLAVPIFDTCFVTIQRLAHRQHPFQGGTDHVSHRLAILGLSVRQTVVALYGVSACLGLLSIVSVTLKPLPAIAMWLSVVTGLVLFGLYLAKVSVYRLEPPPEHEEAAEASSAATRIETMLLHKRRLLELLVDFGLISSVYVFAYLLRFEGLLTGDLQQLIVKSLPIVLGIKLVCFAANGLYRGVWRYFGLTDLIAIVKAVTVASCLSALVLLYVWRFQGYSRAVLIIDWMLTLLAVSGARVAERLLDEWISRVTGEGAPVVIIGAGDAGARTLRLFREEKHTPWRVVGFLDDDLRKWGNRICGIPVLGGRGHLPRVLREGQVREVFIAMSDPPGELLQYVRACCEPTGVVWKVVNPGVVTTAAEA